MTSTSNIDSPESTVSTTVNASVINVTTIKDNEVPDPKRQKIGTSKPRRTKLSPWDEVEQMAKSETSTTTLTAPKNLKLDKPKKSDYRQRAHCNPLSDFLSPQPITPDHVDWSKHYPEICEEIEHQGNKTREELSLIRHDEEMKSFSKNGNSNSTELTVIKSGLDNDNSESISDKEKNTHVATKANNPPQELTNLYLNTHDYPISYDDQTLLNSDSTNGSIRCNKDLKGCNVQFVDIGCGFGGLTVALAEQFPDKISIGLEIREQVTNYVGLRILASRQEYRSRLAELKGLKDKCNINISETNGDRVKVSESDSSTTIAALKQEISEKTASLPHHYYNASVLRTNAMKTMVNYFRPNQLEKLFFCFPDPHFKKKNFRRRIINDALLSMYGYCLCPKGRIYTITDVKELHDWMYESLSEHPLFIEIDSWNKRTDNGKISTNSESKKDVDYKIYTDDEEDPCIRLIHNSTEEGKKVSNLGRFGHYMYFGVFEKREVEVLK